MSDGFDRVWKDCIDPYLDKKTGEFASPVAPAAKKRKPSATPPFIVPASKIAHRDRGRPSSEADQGGLSSISDQLQSSSSFDEDKMDEIISKNFIGKNFCSQFESIDSVCQNVQCVLLSLIKH